MIKNILNSAITKQELTLGVSLEYLRDIAESSPKAFLKLALIGPLGSHRRHLPLEAFHIARLAATLAEDCGTCVQICLNVAQNDNVSADILNAALKRDLASLPRDLADVFQFAFDISSGNDNPELRSNLQAHYGEHAFIELSLAIAISRFFPALKRALGHSTTCSIFRPVVSKSPARLAVAD